MKRNEARRSGLVRTVLGFILAVAVAIILQGSAEPEVEPDHAWARARFIAQERYYEVMDLYRDSTGAVEAARIACKEVLER